MAVVLAAYVLDCPALSRRSALVIENADGRAVVDERVEQDRACIREHDVSVLEEHSEPLEIGEARFLHGGMFSKERRGEALTPLAVTRMRSEEQREAFGCAGLLPPVDEPFHELLLERRVRRRVPHDEDNPARRIEIELPQSDFVLFPGAFAMVDVGLRPTRYDDSLLADAVITDEIVAHDVVLHDVAL